MRAHTLSYSPGCILLVVKALGHFCTRTRYNSMKTFSLVAIWVVVVCLCLLIVKAQPDGWKMTDRFYGFRYEIFGKVVDQSVLDGIQTKANSMGCFGWVQVGRTNNIVGEARCSKAKGKMFQDWLENMPNVERFERLVSQKFQYTHYFFF